MRTRSPMKPATDKRYSIRLEYLGYVTQRYVVRFCGAWVGQEVTMEAAERLRDAYAAARLQLGVRVA